MGDVQNKRKLILEDGSEFEGFSFGSKEAKMFEIVFNTSMVGYQEIISDPSYTYQGVVMTYPLIGNYGMCKDDYETLTPTISAMIVREYCDEPSNFRAEKTLGEVMEKYDITGISGLDTRQIARHIRDYGCCRAYIVPYDKDSREALIELREWKPRTDAVNKVSTKEIFDYADKMGLEANEETYHIVAIDCGMKMNILRELYKRNCKITVVPWNTSAKEIEDLNPDGVFISNGPGDPEDVWDTISTIKELKGKYPIFGICLGHQIISLAYGAKTYKLKFGHRGGNHPVKNLKKDKVEITSQNHSYAVDDKTVADTGLKVTHVNLLDNTVEGVECVEDKVFSVQYHPESAPGPQDSSYLFDEFIDIIKLSREGK